MIFGLYGENSKIEFEFNSNQTYLIKTIEQLNELREKYGEMKGKNNVT